MFFDILRGFRPKYWLKITALDWSCENNKILKIRHQSPGGFRGKDTEKPNGINVSDSDEEVSKQQKKKNKRKWKIIKSNVRIQS